MPRHSQRCGAIALATGFFFTVVCAPAQVRAQGTPKTASPHSEPTPEASDETELTAEERAEIDGLGPGYFSPTNREYLEAVLPLTL